MVKDSRKEPYKLDKTWYEEHLAKTKVVADPRYSPELNVELNIAKIFDGLGRTKAFFDRIKITYGKAKRAYSHAYTKKGVEAAPTGFKQIELCIGELFTLLHNIKPGTVEALDLDKFATLTEAAGEEIWKCVDELRTEAEKIKAASKKSSTPSSPTPYESPSEFNSEIHYLYELNSELRSIQEFARSAEAILSNEPRLLLKGGAGTGKTHLLCDVAEHRIKQGLPTFLLFGEQFRYGDPWAQVISILKLPYKGKDELLTALNEAGKDKNSRALIMIDAINEGAGKGLWRKYVEQLLDDLKDYPYIGLALSVRNGFETSVLIEKQLGMFVTEEHFGFQYNEWEAVTRFFKAFKIKLPEIPVLTPEFQNPLFLKLFCQAFEKSRRSIKGHAGATHIFEAYIKRLNNQLAKEVGFSKEQKIVWEKVIKPVAEWMGANGRETIPGRSVLKIIEAAVPGKSKQLLDSLQKHWLLTKVPMLNQNGRIHSYVYRFPYQKFSDHLIVRYLLNNHLNTRNPKQTFQKSRKLGKIVANPWGSGLVEAIAIQLPERLKGKELAAVAPHFANAHFMKEAFIESIIWRDPKAFSQGTLDYINNYIIEDEYLFHQLLNAFLSVASIPEHPYNADRLHSHLMRFDMPERDSWWSTYIHRQYGYENAVDRLVEWAWADSEKDHIGDESIRLCGVALAWLLTSSNRFLRDRATKALVSLFTNRLYVLPDLLKQFEQVNDPYVSERLYAAAYGAALRNLDNIGLKALAQYVFETIFKNGTPPPHILLRDYARGVVETALYRNIVLDLDENLIRPPYSSEWSDDIPSKEELKKQYYDRDDKKGRGYFTIWFSVVGGGDFDRYVIGTNTWRFDWSSRRIGEPRVPSKKEQYEDFLNSLSTKQKGLYDNAHPSFDIRNFLDFIRESDDEKLQELKKINPEEIENEQKAAQDAFKASLSEAQRKVYNEAVIPYLESPRQDEFAFCADLARCWIFKKVIDLGWTPELFDDFDSAVDRHNRESHKAERIGKKYQWIAYHEFLARVSDNFEFREDRWKDEAGIYEGPWNPGVRDIDPSCLLKGTDNSYTMQECWWVPTNYDQWQQGIEDVAWLKTDSDLPNPSDVIEVTDDNGVKWLILEANMNWQQDVPPEEERYRIPRRDVWCMLKSYVVRKKDFEEFFTWAKKQDFMGRWMPESHEFYDVFLREYPWAAAFRNICTEDYSRHVWVKDYFGKVPFEVLLTSDEYMQESKGFDRSVNNSIHIQLPAHWVIEGMNLKPTNNDGEFVDDDGNIVAFDPSVNLPGPNATLVNKELLTKFLADNGYEIVWTVLGEKTIMGGDFDHKDWKGRLEISGAYALNKGTLDGQIATKFVK